MSNSAEVNSSLPAAAEAFLVGGAVRDLLLGLPVVDRDFVVVGAGVPQMKDAGFTLVGADFPVFLHPVSGEEFALARTERKSGRGYAGFTVHADPSVTLEEDLQRRDFTINAMAQSLDGERLIDPYGGAADIEARVLRHVSDAFAEDPLRILRAARFMARLEPLNFTIADETLDLMRSMVTSGELDSLVPERVFRELRRALTEASPGAFLRVLRSVGALKVVLPEVDSMYGVPQRAEYHPEVDTGVHVEMVLAQCAQIAPGDDLIGFCALTHDLGKALTPDHVLPSHRGHESAGLEPLQSLCDRLRVPVGFEQLARVVCRDHLKMHQLSSLRGSTVLKMFKGMDAFRKPERVAQFATVCECDARGRLGLEHRDYPQKALLLEAFKAAQKIAARDVRPELSGPAIGLAIDKLRARAITDIVKGPPET